MTTYYQKTKKPQNVCIRILVNPHQLPFLLLSTVEAKKRRSAGHQPKEPVPESTRSVFVTFLGEAGITLRQDGTPNEICKTLAL